MTDRLVKDTKVGIIVPTTTKGKKFNTILDSPIVNVLFRSFIETVDNKPGLSCVFYIGYDYNDPLFSKDETIFILTKFLSGLNNELLCKFVKFPENIKPGHLTRMWNILYDEAYNDNCDYMYQCGDDIEFLTKDWLLPSINLLRNNNDIGMSGPVCDHPYILTQALFSRKHKDILGRFLEEDIKNWFLDDYYNLLYTPNNVFVYFEGLCRNTVQSTSSDGNYKVVNIKIEDVVNYANRDKLKIKEYQDGILV